VLVGVEQQSISALAITLAVGLLPQFYIKPDMYYTLKKDL